MLTRSEAIFAVRDVPETIAFYRDVLGFESGWLWGTPVGFGGARWGKAHVMFCLQPERAAKVEGHMHFFHCDDIESLHNRHVAAGAKIVSPIDNKPWGVREYTVRDPNGYHLRFSGPLKYEGPVTALKVMPEHIQIVERNPTREEFYSVYDSIGWDRAMEPTRILEHGFAAFVAIDTRSSTVVGVTRVVRDAINWYSIWDVAVHESYHGQKIGSALITAAVERIRRESAGAIINLFTQKDGFYQQLGFQKENTLLRRL
ncbi:hypothetical protein BH10PLA1_BH10PLA1_13040 [soil metagenome]